VDDTHALLDHKLYWAAASSVEEAQYLTAVLNNPALTQLLAPMQSRGEHNPRDFDKLVWRGGSYKGLYVTGNGDGDTTEWDVFTIRFEP
jgi:hypothetical protein